jgi:hypothetical protein
MTFRPLVPLFLPLLVLAWPARAAAQPIHGHPQKAAYASPAEWKNLSGQEHWFLPAEHVHADIRCPIYREVNAGESVTCFFTITFFHFDGSVVRVEPGFHNLESPTTISWDATGTATPPPLTGDPGAVKLITGSFSTQLPPTVQGWWPISLRLVWHANATGDEGRDEVLGSVWSTQVVDAAVRNSLDFPLVSSRGVVFGAVNPAVTWGNASIDVVDYLPLLPIAAPWSVRVGWYSYTGVALEPAREQVRLDLDLHNGIEGTMLFDEAHEDFSSPFGHVATFDPAAGPGPHKLALVRIQPNTATGEQQAQLLVYGFTVDPNAPVPTTCTDPTATNVGGPLPCTYPPPAPLLCQDPTATNVGGPLPCLFPLPPSTDEWRSIVPWFEQEVINGVPQLIFRFCISATQCFALPNVPRL